MCSTEKNAICNIMKIKAKKPESQQATLIANDLQRRHWGTSTQRTHVNGNRKKRKKQDKPKKI